MSVLRPFVEIGDEVFWFYGDDVYGMLVEFEGVVRGFSYVHKKQDGSLCFGYAPINSETEPRWTVEKLEPLTLSPSLLCGICGHHGFIKNDRWVPA